jgi:hypothetical protein
MTDLVSLVLELENGIRELEEEGESLKTEVQNAIDFNRQKEDEQK